MAQSECIDIADARPAPRLPDLLSRLADWRALRRQRIALSRLDDHRLRDLGITRAEAEREAARPMWDAPGHWYR